MRQILYSSVSSPPGERADVDRILEQSRHNNALDGVSGLLWSDGLRFLQVFEGPEESVAATLARIERDPRHEAMVILSDKAIEEREFGDWAMRLHNGDERDEDYAARIVRILDRASPEIRQAFLRLVASGTGQV